MSKTVLGIGYILLAIPGISFVGLIIVPIGWILLGRNKGRGLWTATGVIGLLTFILAIALVVSAPFIMGTLFGGMMGGEIGTAMTASATVLALLAAVAILGLIYAILMLISLWQAGNYYRTSLLKIAVILWILIVIVALVGVALIYGAITGGAAEIATGSVWMVVIGAAVLNFIANILAGVGFLAAKEPTQVQYGPTAQVPPPPPPAVQT